jgi:DNA-binding phage protein
MTMQLIAISAATKSTISAHGFCVLVVVLLLSGLLGGLVAYLIDLSDRARIFRSLNDSSGQAKTDRRSKARTKADHLIDFSMHMLLGIAASLVVPLFLNTISSSLVSEAINGDKEPRQALLTIMGFCIIAAVSSRRFIDSITDSVIRDFKSKIENQDQQIESLNEKASQALDLASVETEPETFDEGQSLSEPFIKDYRISALSERENKVISAIRSKTYRSRASASIARDLGMKESEVLDLLEDLARKEFAIMKTTPKGLARWSLTERAIQDAVLHDEAVT